MITFDSSNDASWQTQTPVDIADLKHQLRELQQKYDDLVNTHASIILGMYRYDQSIIGDAYRYSMFSPKNPSRKELDSRILQLTTPPPFRAEPKPQ